MAIDHRILQNIGVKDNANAINMFQNALSQNQNRKAQAQQMQQRAESFPLLQQQRQQTVDQGVTDAQNAKVNQTLQSIVAFSPTLKPLLQQGNYTEALNVLQQRKQQLASQGRDFTDTDEAISEIVNGNPDNVLQALNVAEREFSQRKNTNQGVPAGVREFEILSNIALNDPDPKRRKQAEIALGTEARAGSITGKERGATDPTLGDQLANQAGNEAGAVEAAKLTAKLKLEPKVKAAVSLALSNVKLLASDKKLAKTNERAYNLYQVGIDGLSTALEDASTGVFSGTMFALSDNNRIAQGAGAVMLPILKAMFRTAGEGTFTDQDQKILSDMVPTTNDTPKVRKAKLLFIDAVVKTKLGATSETISPAAAEGLPLNTPNAAPPQQFNIENLDIDSMSEEQLNELERQLAAQDQQGGG